MGPAEGHLRLGTDIPTQGSTRRPVVLAVVVLAGGLIDEPAVAAVHQGVDPQRQGVVDRQVHQTLEAALVVFAQPDAEARLEFVAGLVGGDGHGAGGAVAAEQGALRSFQHLDPGHVAERQQAGARARRIDAVDIDAHRLVGADAEVRRRDPANAVLGLGRTGVRHREARHEGGDVAHVVRRQRFQGLGRDDADRDRDFLQALFAPLRGDDDIIEGRGLLRRRQTRRGQGGQRHAPRQRRLATVFHLGHRSPSQSPVSQTSRNRILFRLTRGCGSMRRMERRQVMLDGLQTGMEGDSDLARVARNHHHAGTPRRADAATCAR